MGGLGVVAVGVGSFAGLTASSAYNEASKSCGTPPACPKGSVAFSQRDSASTWATVSNITFAAGGVLLAAGAVLYFTAPSGPSGGSAPAVGLAPVPGGAALAVAQTF